MPPESENQNPEQPVPSPDGQSGSGSAPDKGQSGSDQSGTDSEKPSGSHRRNGRVAQLPKVLRDQISQMILDGVPYTKILETIGDPVKHINPGNVSEWKKGGWRSRGI